MIHILGSVGHLALNRFADVLVVQKALNVYRRRYRRGRSMPETGKSSFDVVDTIKDLQRKGGISATGRIEPMSPTLRVLDRAGGLRDIGSVGFTPSSVIAGTIEVLVSDGRLWSQGSQWGHVAIDVDGIVFSRAHNGYDAKPREHYLNANSFRETVGLVLRFSESEISIVRSELRRRVAANAPYDLIGNSCSTNVADVLEMVGVLAHDPRFKWDAAATTAVSPKEVLIIVSRSPRMRQRNVYPKTK